MWWVWQVDDAHPITSAFSDTDNIVDTLYDNEGSTPSIDIWAVQVTRRHNHLPIYASAAHTCTYTRTHTHARKRAYTHPHMCARMHARMHACKHCVVVDWGLGPCTVWLDWASRSTVARRSASVSSTSFRNSPVLRHGHSSFPSELWPIYLWPTLHSRVSYGLYTYGPLFIPE